MSTDTTGRQVWAPVPPVRGKSWVRKALGAAWLVWSHPANRGQRLRVAERALRYQFRARVLGLPTRAPIGRRSAILAYRGETNSPRSIYASPCDWPEMLVWPRLLRPGDLFLDIGANVGVYSVLAADCGATTVCVEPDERTAARLRENLELNGYPVEVHRCALADSPGELQFTTGLDSYNHLVTDSSSLGDDRVTVPVRTLDDVLGDRTAAGVKIDVEGAELLVLKGAHRALTERRLRVIQMEWSHFSRNLLGTPRTDVEDLLQSYGYSLFRPDRFGDLQPVVRPAEGRDVFAMPNG